MFRLPTETVSKFYLKRSSEMVQLGGNEAQAKCPGESTLKDGDILPNNSIHVNKLSNRLFSTGHICGTGSIVAFTKTEAIVVDRSGIDINRDAVISLFHRNSRTRLYETFLLPAMISASSLVKTIEQWLHRLVHTSRIVIQKLHHSALNFVQPSGSLEPCHACLIGKVCERPFKPHF